MALSVSILDRLPDLAREVERVSGQWDAFWSGERNRLVLADVNFPGGINFPRMHIGSRAQVPKRELFSDSEAYLAYQLDRLIDRLDMRIGDDFIPTLWPWFGVGVLQTAYGCSTTWPPNDDPWVAPCADTVNDALETLPDNPLDNGLLPRVIECETAWHRAIDGAIPIRVTDVQSPLDVAMQIVETSSFFSAVVDKPEDVHALLSHVTTALNDWISLQKTAIPSVWPACWQYRMPDGKGIGVSDDAVVIVSPDCYREFGARYIEQVSKAHDGVFIHCCAQPVPLTQEHVKAICEISGAIGLETHVAARSAKQVAGTLQPGQVISCLATGEDPIAISRSLAGHRAIIYVVRNITNEHDLHDLRADINAIRKQA